MENARLPFNPDDEILDPCSTQCLSCMRTEPRTKGIGHIRLLWIISYYNCFSWGAAEIKGVTFPAKLNLSLKTWDLSEKKHFEILNLRTEKNLSSDSCLISLRSCFKIWIESPMQGQPFCYQCWQVLIDSLRARPRAKAWKHQTPWNTRMATAIFSKPKK